MYFELRAAARHLAELLKELEQAPEPDPHILRAMIVAGERVATVTRLLTEAITT